MTAHTPHDFSNAFANPSQASAQQDAIAAHMRAAARREGHVRALPPSPRTFALPALHRRILIALRDNGPMTSKDLSGNFGWASHGNIGSALSDLSSHGAIHSVGKRAQGGRSLIVWAIDDAGLAAIEGETE